MNILNLTTLLEGDKQTLLECAKWLKEEGYYHPKGYLCGADFFRSATDLKLIEMNVRWTGGQVPYRLLEKLSIGNEDVYSFYDQLSLDKIKIYQSFVDNNLYHPGKSITDFKVLPLGISPHIQREKEREFMRVWMMVIGNIHAFTEAKNAVLGKEELPTSNKIAAKMAENIY